MNESRSLERILVRGRFDWVLSHDLVVIGSDFEYPIGLAGRARVMRILGRLLGEGLMVPGELGDAGFEDWPGAVTDWIDRSRAELDRLDWRPRSEGFWLRLTERGALIAAELEERG